VESMKTAIESILEFRKDQIRKHFLKYTRKAFQIIPTIKNPQILDVGCGSGIPAIELAKLSNGKIIAIDINLNLLNKLDKRIQAEGLTKRIFTENCSLFNIDFPDETFDIIWAEGSIHIIGFEFGLKQWRHLLKPGGFLVVHDGIKEVSNKLKNLPNFGYMLFNHFALLKDVWWKNYFQLLEQLINNWHKKTETEESRKLLESYQNEVNMFKKNPKENASAFYIFQKIESDKLNPKRNGNRSLK
jgi:ubiquinone/menaquinone biosynthesis C-methylase UbiE